MATDYDSPRKTDDDLSEDSLEELKARRQDKSASTVDVDEAELAESLELPGADLSNEELSVRVLPRQAEVLHLLLPRIRDIRRAGAATLDLCALACGRVDAYYEQGLKPWDLAAGGLIAEESGAVVGGLRGRPAGEALVVAAPPGLFERLVVLLTELDADRVTG